MGVGSDDQFDAPPEVPQQLLIQALDLVGQAVVITNADGVIVFWNAAASNVLGWSRSDALGRNVADVVARAASREQAQTILERVQAGQSWHGEFPVVQRGGSSVQALVTITPTLDQNGTIVALTAVASDVTALGQATHDLETSAGMFAALLQGAGDLFAITEADGVIRWIGGPVEAILGVEPGALVGSSLFDLVMAHDLERARALWAERVTTTAAMPGEDFWTQRADKAWVCLNLLTNNLLDDPSIGGIAITARDVTARKQNERALRTMVGGNAALINVTTEDDLFAEICRVVVADDAYSFAWLGLGDPTNQLGVRMVASSGASAAYFDAIEALSGTDTFRGPLVEAWRRHEVGVVSDTEAEPDSPWRLVALDFGYRSIIALPLPIGDDNYGVLAIFAAAPHAFTDSAVEILTSLTRDLAHGVNALRARAERALYKARFDSSLEAAVQAIATAGELRDPYTAGHQRRVAELATAVATELGLDPALVVGIGVAASIHDIGKLAIPAEILSKPGRLSDNEFALVKEHAQAGHDIVSGIDFVWPVAEMVLQHHERLDGSGYPAGLRGEQISIGARIIAVADVVEAMRSHRPYRPGLGLPTALSTLAEGRDTLFDPDVVDACLRLFHEQRFEFTL